MVVTNGDDGYTAHNEGPAKKCPIYSFVKTIFLLRHLQQYNLEDEPNVSSELCDAAPSGNVPVLILFLFQPSLPMTLSAATQMIVTTATMAAFQHLIVRKFYASIVQMGHC